MIYMFFFLDSFFHQMLLFIPISPLALVAPDKAVYASWCSLSVFPITTTTLDLMVWLCTFQIVQA